MSTSMNFLLARVHTLNMMLGRPLEQFASKPGEPTRFSVGHIHLDHNTNGYSLEEQTADHGAVYVMVPRLTAKEMSCMLDGMIKGINMHTQYVSDRVQLLHKAGLCVPA